MGIRIDRLLLIVLEDIEAFCIFELYAVVKLVSKHKEYKMNWKTFSLVVLVGYIFYLVGGTASMVGTVSKCSTEPTQWYVPILVFVLVGMPAYLGYVYGKESAEID